MWTEPVLLQPIGYVHHAVPDAEVAQQRRDLVAEIHIADTYRTALDGIEQYSHLFVLFWMHRVTKSGFTNRVHPRNREDLPLTGVFATRGRQRPNPIGLAVAELLERTDTGLRVRRLDAYDGTPVIDLKPYDDYDVFTKLKLPAWWRSLQDDGHR
jgi:tRNA-Thr(GGU) m(6)t(6)A37 methyltransferase TsaA